MSSLTRALAARAVAPLAFSALLACSSETQVNLLEPVQTAVDASTPEADADTAEAPDAESADAASMNQHLIHRYSFDGELGGTLVIDSVGAENGVLQGGAKLTGSGQTQLDGIDDYVNLPNGLVSSLTDATLVAWIYWSGRMGDCWQRVFDFGDSDQGEDLSNMATTTFFATPLHCGGTGLGPTAYYENNPNKGFGAVDSDVPFPRSSLASIAVVFDWTDREMRLYVGGVLLSPTVDGQEKLTAPLSMLSDVNDWLGRSQFIGDPYLSGTYDEFRIYDTALSSEQIAALDQAGPDVVAP